MKKSLSSKVLVLSLAALVVVGSGCERRGRAPKKAAANDAVVSANKPVVDVAADGEKKKTEVSSDTSKAESVEEAKTITDAKMNCAITINTNETPSAATFEADADAMTKLISCLEGSEAKPGYGIVLKNSKIDGVQHWEVIADDLKAGRDGISAESRSPLLVEFDALSKKSNDDDARAILEARLKVLIINSEKMLKKYTPSSLPSDTEVKMSKGSFTVSSVLTNFPALIEACTIGTEKVSRYVTVRDGVDLTDASEGTPYAAE